MSFFGNLSNLAAEAQSLLGNANGGDVAQAAQTHVASSDPDELAGHLQQSVPNMDSSHLMALGTQLLGALRANGTSDQALQNAGADPQAAQSGDPTAVSALISASRLNPQALQSAAVALVEQHPDVVTRFAPPLLQGILGRLSGSA